MGTHSQDQIALLTDYDSSSQYSMAYHTTFYNIRSGWDREKLPQLAILLVTPTATTGQGTASANVAIAAAQNGTPTILVDADLQNPGLQQRFGISQQQPGLGELLSVGTSTTQALSSSLHKTFIPDLYVLGAGTTPRPVIESRRLFSSNLSTTLKDLRSFLEKNEERPGLIVFHSAPVLVNPDALIIGSHVDQTFLTIVAGRTTRSQASKAQEQLERAHVPLTGALLLNV